MTYTTQAPLSSTPCAKETLSIAVTVMALQPQGQPQPQQQPPQPPQPPLRNHITREEEVVEAASQPQQQFFLRMENKWKWSNFKQETESKLVNIFFVAFYFWSFTRKFGGKMF